MSASREASLPLAILRQVAVPEGPAHEVELSTFYMERTEVTKAHFEEVYQWALRERLRI